MKRRGFKLLLFLFAGAIINVAVAWGFAITVDLGRSIRTSIRTDRDEVRVRRHEVSYFTGALVYRRRFSPNRYPDLVTNPRKGVDPPWLLRCECTGQSDLGVEAFGWPLLTVYSIRCDGQLNKSYRNGIEVRWLARSNGFVWSTVRLPTVALWPGFAINTIFYTALLCVLFAFLGTVRRRRRIKRGQCAWCAYPIGENSVCSECGKPARSERVEPTA